MVKHLSSAPGIQVDYLFTGRHASKYFAMEPFGNWTTREGLSFTVENGRIKPLATLLNSRPWRLLSDIKQLPVHNYDLVISDFEPVTAWAARRQGKPCLGLGHQYAFNYDIPKKGGNRVSQLIMQQFAPAEHSLGMHWYHFNQPILPPIVDVHASCPEVETDLVIVYLPFEAPARVKELIKDLDGYRFLYYGDFPVSRTEGNIVYNPVSREGFQRDLARCGGVICNAGFELSSEAISLGKKLLVKPLRGQMEQISNGFALEQLRLGVCVDTLTPDIIGRWLKDSESVRIDYPDVARFIVDWILGGKLDDKDQLIRLLWQKTNAHGLETFKPYPG
jgi:uncharacterized protein (TIGR00661 family)